MKCESACSHKHSPDWLAYVADVRLRCKRLFIAILEDLLHFRFRSAYRLFLRMYGLHRQLNYLPTDLGERIVVYTVLFGEYDTIKPIKVKNPLCDYYIFTDQDVPKDSGWIKRDPPSSIVSLEFSDNVLKSRYYRMFAHLLFPNNQISVYVDASLTLRHDIVPLITRMGESAMALFSHPYAHDIYDEANCVLRWRRAPEALVRSQVERYRTAGYPRRFGAFTTGVMVRRHLNGEVNRLMEGWWQEFEKPGNTKRDQMCLTYVMWRMGMKAKSIRSLGPSVYDDPLFFPPVNK